MKEDAELKQFRDLMPRPDHFEDGFGWKAIFGALFVGVIMTPASMYMQLVTGQDVGGAAQWVTVILFIEVARRSFTTLRRPEIFILYSMAGSALAGAGPGQGLLWQQYLVQSDALRAFGVAENVPWWVAPSDPETLGTRSFFDPAWAVPIGLFALATILQRFDNFGLAYIMFRLTSDVEKLPFPLAPVNAQGIVALADASDGRETWRWRVFSFGAMLGLGFGAVYIALPTITGALLPQPIQIFPIPFVDLTTNYEELLPTVPLLFSFDLKFLILGMVLPFWAMVGSFVGLLFTLLVNPLVLRPLGVLDTWSPGTGAIRTIQANTLDFYFSFGLGLTFAIAVIGIWHVASSFRQGRRTGETSRVDLKALFNPPKGRGDFPLWVAMLVYVVTMSITIATAFILLKVSHGDDPANVTDPSYILLGVFVFYGFVYTPIVSYVSARMEGIVGMTVQVPFIREATFILSGYQGAAVWFTPFPYQDYGREVLYFRTTELTGTTILSRVKAELFVLPIVIVSMVVFSHFIWQIAPVPSSAFPYAEQYWDLIAYQRGLIWSSTLPGGENGPFAQAFVWEYLFLGLGGAVGLYAALSFFGLPVLLVYGVIRGLDQSLPHVILPQFLGALLGRYYFRRKFGEQWPHYIIVFFAGYMAGEGLVAMFSLGTVFISKSVITSPY